MRSAHGFSLVELLVVVTILVILLALLAPAMDRAVDQAVRTRCAAQQKSILTASVAYGTMNRGTLIICKGRWVQECFSPLGSTTSDNLPGDAAVDWPAALASVGLASAEKADTGIPDGQTGSNANRVDNLPGKVWDCPAMRFGSKWDQSQAYQLIVGYMYHGGMLRWKNPYNTNPLPARSPSKLTTSRGDWVLLSEHTVKVDGVWAGGRWAYYYPDIPAHKADDRDDGAPAGQNQAFMDGSVQWIDAHRLIDIGNWWGDLTHQVYWYQQDLGGWVPPPEAYAVQ